MDRPWSCVQGSSPPGHSQDTSTAHRREGMAGEAGTAQHQEEITARTSPGQPQHFPPSLLHWGFGKQAHPSRAELGINHGIFMEHEEQHCPPPQGCADHPERVHWGNSGTALLLASLAKPRGTESTRAKPWGQQRSFSCPLAHSAPLGRLEQKQLSCAV